MCRTLSLVGWSAADIRQQQGGPTDSEELRRLKLRLRSFLYRKKLPTVRHLFSDTVAIFDAGGAGLLLPALPNLTSAELAPILDTAQDDDDEEDEDANAAATAAAVRRIAAAAPRLQSLRAPTLRVSDSQTFQSLARLRQLRALTVEWLDTRFPGNGELSTLQRLSLDRALDVGLLPQLDNKLPALTELWGLRLSPGGLPRAAEVLGGRLRVLQLDVGFTIYVPGGPAACPPVFPHVTHLSLTTAVEAPDLLHSALGAKLAAAFPALTHLAAVHSGWTRPLDIVRGISTSCPRLAGLTNLQSLALIRGAMASEDNWADMAALPTLTALCCVGVESDFKRLAALTNLEVLEFSFGDEATLDPAAVRASLASAPMRRLHTLHVRFDWDADPDDIAAIKVVGDCCAALFKLVQAAPALKTLQLSESWQLDHNEIVALGSHPGLERLVLPRDQGGVEVESEDSEEAEGISPLVKRQTIEAMAAHARPWLAPTVDVVVEKGKNEFGSAEVWSGMRMPC
jgi:hypothetical protein